MISCYLEIMPLLLPQSCQSSCPSTKNHCTFYQATSFRIETHYYSIVYRWDCSVTDQKHFEKMHKHIKFFFGDKTNRFSERKKTKKFENKVKKKSSNALQSCNNRFVKLFVGNFFLEKTEKCLNCAFISY